MSVGNWTGGVSGWTDKHVGTYICLYVCKFAHVYVDINVRMFIWLAVPKHVCAHIRVSVCAYVCCFLYGGGGAKIQPFTKKVNLCKSTPRKL